MAATRGPAISTCSTNFRFRGQSGPPGRRVILRMRETLWRLLMPRNVTVQSNAAPIANLLAFALGAAAVGAIAIGALVVSRVAIDRLSIRRARFAKLEVDELTVRKLHVVENSGSIR